MSNPTTPFSWQMPTATDLVTDLPADFEVFGQAVATSMGDLLGGTTGQVLSKTSATDMAFTWVAQDDSNAIQNAIVTAKGNLIGASASATPLVLAVGTNGQTLVADSTASTGLKWATASSGALTLITSGTITTAATSGTTFDGVFTGTYRNYLVLMTDLATSTNQELRLQTRTGGVTASGGVYYGSRTATPSSGAAVLTQTAAGTSTPIVIMQTGGTGVSNMQLWFSSVAVGQRPTWDGTGFDITASASVTEGYSSATASAIDGFILSVASGTFSGLIKVYGVSN